MEIKVNDKYILHSKNGMDYRIEIININEFREPSSNGIILEAVKCVITEDNAVLNYDICNKSNKILLSIGVMRF